MHEKNYRTLIINPKTNSTVIALFQLSVCIFKDTLIHDTSFYHAEDNKAEAKARARQIVGHIKQAGINLSKIDAICANGGLLRPLIGGTYEVSHTMLDELMEQKHGIHASNLGAIIANDIALDLNIAAYIVDPPVVNELSAFAKVTGLPGIERKSIFHALNQKYVARQAAEQMKLTYENAHLIVAHIGRGITIGAHKNGQVIDVNNGLHGDGPFSIERAGTIPSEGLINLCYSGVFTQEELIEEITYQGGLQAYLHTDNMIEIENRMMRGDTTAQHVVSAMAFQIAKEIGSMSAVLRGHVDGIVLTGHQVESSFLSDQIMEQVNWIADVFIYPGEYDLFALNEGVLRILKNQETVKKYEDVSEGEYPHDEGI